MAEINNEPPPSPWVRRFAPLVGAAGEVLVGDRRIELDHETELQNVREQLLEIALLRLDQTFGEDALA